MPTEIFSFPGACIAVQAENPDDLVWLREFLCPWFDSAKAVPDAIVRVVIDSRRHAQLCSRGIADVHIAAFMMDTRIIRYPLLNDRDDGRAFHDESRNVFFQLHGSGVDLICRDPEADYRLVLMRVIREYSMSAAQLAGGRFLHAAAVARNGRALVVTGPRGAGKTSLLTYLLGCGKVGFLANDRLLVTGEEGAVQVRGMPTVVSIRDGTFRFFPSLLGSLESRGFNSRVTIAAGRSSDGVVVGGQRPGKKGLSPAQYCALTSSVPVRNAVAAAVVVPVQTGQPGGVVLRPLDGEHVLEQLRRGLFGHIGPGSLSEAFSVRPPAGNARPGWSDEQLLDYLSRNVPAYSCEMGTDAYCDQDGANTLLQLLHSSADRRSD